MKLMIGILLAFPLIAAAQVGVGDVDLNCSGSQGSLHLTKYGRQVMVDGNALSLGRNGLYKDASGRSIEIRSMLDARSGLVSVFNPQGNLQGRFVCYGQVHSYKLQYDRQGFPVRAIVPRDGTPPSQRYRCVTSEKGVPLQDCNQ